MPPEAPSGRPSDHLTSGLDPGNGEIVGYVRGQESRMASAVEDDGPDNHLAQHPDPDQAASLPEDENSRVPDENATPDAVSTAPLDRPPTDDADDAVPAAHPLEEPPVAEPMPEGSAASSPGSPEPTRDLEGDGVPPYPAYPAGVTEGCGAGTTGLATSDAAPGGSKVSASTEVGYQALAGEVAPTPGTSETPPATTRTAAKSTTEEEEEEEEEGGGPVKPFLDHLEDLRWMLVKVISSIALGMLVCLVASDKLVSFLMWPLKHAQHMLPLSHQKVPLLLGTNQINKVTANSLGLSSTPSNRVTAVTLQPLLVGSNYVLTLQVKTNSLSAGEEPDMVVLKNYGPISAFMVALKLALYGGMVLSSPFVIFFIGQFVLPALKVKEKAFLYRVAGFGSVLFVVGIAFCYFLIIQVALMASVQFSQWMGFGADEWRAEDYVSFVSKFMLGTGLSFQLPLVILTLVKIGLVDYKMLSAWRQYFIVGNLVVSAVVTPSGDPLTMVLMALPLQVLYEASLLIARRWARKEQEREAAEG